jgi:hypothetical protein
MPAPQRAPGSRSPSPWRSPPTRRSAAAAARTRIATARLLEFVASYGAPTRVPLERPGRPRVTARHDHPCRHRSAGPSAARGPFNSNGPPASRPDRHPPAQVRRNRCPGASERLPKCSGIRAQVPPESAPRSRRNACPSAAGIPNRDDELERRRQHRGGPRVPVLRRLSRLRFAPKSCETRQRRVSGQYGIAGARAPGLAR